MKQRPILKIRRSYLPLIMTIVCATAGCTSSTSDAPSETTQQNLDCVDGTRWAPGQQAFTDATDAWQLMGVEGTRLLAVDYNGDGWTDLVVSRGGSGGDNFVAGGHRNNWLLKNIDGTRFEDVTETSGFRAPRQTTGDRVGRPGQVVAFADVDNDGDLDAYTGLNDADGTVAETSEILLNQGDGTFVLGPANNLVRREGGDVPAGATFVDYNRDSRIDLWVVQNGIDYLPQQDQLMRGDGTGLFGDVSASVGLTTKRWSSDVASLNAGEGHSWGWSSAACDMNNDGNPDLLASSYGRLPNHLWQATDDYTFINRSQVSGYAYDHRQDWTDNESAQCWCLHHPDDEDCAGVPAPQRVHCDGPDDVIRWDHRTSREPSRLGGNSGATVCADINNDGNFDLLTTEIVHWDVGSSSDPSEILFNTGNSDITFERPGNDVTGMVREYAMTDWNEGDISASIFDFDNDTWPDIYLGNTDYPGNRGLLYQQTEPGKFTQVAVADSIDHFRSHGSAVADFDRDGDLDIVVGHSHMRCDGNSPECYATMQIRLFENETGGNFVQLSLEGGPETNRAAIGARVEVTAAGVTQTQEVGGGFGHYGNQNDLTLHFGLAEACEATVTIRWPDYHLTTETVTLQAGGRYHIRQGQDPQLASP